MILAGRLDIIALAVAAVLLVSGTAKLLPNAHFARVLSTTYAFSDGHARFLGLLVPAAELLIGASLILGVPTPLLAWLLAGTFLAATTAAVIRAWYQGAAGDCGCFGALRKEPLSGRTLGRSGLLLFIVVLGFYLQLQVPGTEAAGVPRDVALLLVLMGGAFLVVLAALTADVVWRLRRTE